MDRTNQHGFTLWELLVTLLVAGVLLGIGVPNLMEMQRTGLVTAAANDIVTATLRARSEAITRHVPVTLCLSDDPTAAAPHCAPSGIANSTTRGFFVWVDENGNSTADGTPKLDDATDGNAQFDAGETVLMQAAPPGGTIRVSADCGYAAYRPTGFTRAVPGLCGGATTRTILICDDRGRRATYAQLSSARAVTIDRLGRAQALQELADLNTVVNTTLSAVSPTCP